MSALDPPLFTLHRGSTPLVVSLPHTGTALPHFVQPRLQQRALAVEDTDWHLDVLYAFARDLGASLLSPTYSRYLIDLNRPADNQPMYPGANNTELCPTRFFNGDPLYREGLAPDEAEIARRRDLYWRPYHDALQSESQRLRALHGHAVVFDGHSIKSVLPWLFEGRLPDLNLGTVSGTSCDATLREALTARLRAQDAFTHVADGRFKGGHITRFYGRPREGVHAVQLEMAFRCYMIEDAEFVVVKELQARLAPVLRSLVETMIAWRPQ
jgi:N-formylglutamate deformylase